ncbi:hypothetical protein QTN25_008439 [Entamoeba marina]
MIKKTNNSKIQMIKAPTVEQHFKEWLEKQIPRVFVFGNEHSFHDIYELCLNSTPEELKEHAETFYSYNKNIMLFFNAIVERQIILNAPPPLKTPEKDSKKKVKLETGMYF